MDFGKTKGMGNIIGCSVFILWNAKAYSKFEVQNVIEKTPPKCLPIALMFFVHVLGRHRYSSTPHLRFSKIRSEISIL